MDAINYRLETFEGPLDLLLSLIQKNKMSIDDIQINVICEQYMEYIETAQSLDMELASEFIVMASELMLIKSKLLLPKPEAEEEDPRAALADALLKFQQAKEAAKKMALLYPVYSGRLEKDTDEISIDKTFVLDQEVESLCLAVRRIITFNENRPKVERSVFTPMISSPIVPVEVKITGILNKMSKKKATSLKELLDEYDYEYTTDALDSIIDEWAKQKAPLIEAFKNHPNYVDGKFMIVFDTNYDREINTDVLYNFKESL